MAGQPPQDTPWQSGQENARAAWQPQEESPYEPLAETAKHPVQSFDAPPPGDPGQGYPPPRRDYAAGRPQGYSAGSPGYGAADQQASFDLPGNGQQAAWQAQAPTAGRPARGRGKGFLASLFDFGFTSFVTPTLVKAIYVLAVLWTVLWAIVFIDISFKSGGVTGGLFVLILIIPVFALLSLASIRVFLEIFMALHRINENIQAIRDQDNGPGDGRL
jgi:uncharacterized membrane protein